MLFPAAKCPLAMSWFCKATTSLPESPTESERAEAEAGTSKAPAHKTRATKPNVVVVRMYNSIDAPALFALREVVGAVIFCRALQWFFLVARYKQVLVVWLPFQLILLVGKRQVVLIK